MKRNPEIIAFRLESMTLQNNPVMLSLAHATMTVTVKKRLLALLHVMHTLMSGTWHVFWHKNTC